MPFKHSQTRLPTDEGSNHGDQRHVTEAHRLLFQSGRTHQPNCPNDRAPTDHSDQRRQQTLPVQRADVGLREPPGQSNAAQSTQQNQRVIAPSFFGSMAARPEPTLQVNGRVDQPTAQARPTEQSQVENRQPPARETSQSDPQPLGSIEPKRPSTGRRAMVSDTGWSMATASPARFRRVTTRMDRKFSSAEAKT